MSMTEQKYPFTAFVLTPAMLIKEVELARKGRWGAGYSETIGGKSYHETDLYSTPQAALSAGRKKLDAQRTRVKKQQSAIEKRTANLDYAAAKL
jgi:hypothetical protein